MQPDPSRRGPLTGFLLALALTLSGTLLFVLQPVFLKLVIPRFGIELSQSLRLDIDSPFAVSGVIAILLAAPLSRVRNMRWLGGVLIVMLLAMGPLLGLGLWDLRHDPDATVWVAAISAPIVTVLVVLVSLLLVTWHARQDSSTFRPLFLFAFFFFGCNLGLVGYPLVIEPFLILAQQIYCVAILLAGTFLLFLGAYASLLSSPSYDGTRSSPPTWVQRLRWAALGGMPVCVVAGSVNYISAEISPIPFLWVAAGALYHAAWVVALARMTGEKNMALAGFVQALAFATLSPVLWLAWHFDRTGDSVMWALLLLGGIAGIFWAPHRFVLPLQGGMAALVLMQYFLNLPFSVTQASGVKSIIVVQLFHCAVVCWGSHGDIIKDAPASDRLPELALCVLVGVLVCSIAYAVMPPSVFPGDILEYPLAIGAALVLRAMVWPWLRNKKPGDLDHRRA